MSGLPANDEKTFLTRIADGDQAAFALLFDQYHHGLGAFIFGITKSREIAEEIVIDAFLKIWMTRETLAEIQNFKAYLFTISRNAAITALRKTIREREKREDWVRDHTEAAAEETDNKETYLSIIDEAIDQLSPQRKKIYLLSRRDGLKYEEIASQLGLSRFTVRAHIQQAVDSILTYIKPRINKELLLAAVLLHWL